MRIALSYTRKNLSINWKELPLKDQKQRGKGNAQQKFNELRPLNWK
jgi:hypothetical protein